MGSLNPAPSEVRLRAQKRDKKRGGFFWFWSKVKTLLIGGTEEGVAGSATSFGGAASAASRVGAVAGGGVGPIAIWMNHAAVLALGISIVVAGFSMVSPSPAASSAQSGNPHFGPITSFIHLFRPGSGEIASNGETSGGASSFGNSPSGVLKTSADPGTGDAGKAGVANATGASGNTAQFHGNFTGLPSAKLSTDLNDGAPIAPSMPNRGGQAAQEAILVKNGNFTANNKISVTPMSATALSPYLAAYVGIGNKGRGFSRSFGGLRGMSEYVQPMSNASTSCSGGSASCDTAAGNAINQWQNAPIENDGGGISMGGANSGNADSKGTPNPTGGSGSSSQGASFAGDISNACSADQIQKGYISSGGTCSPGYKNNGNNATPWQKHLDSARLLIQIVASILAYAAIYFFLADILATTVYGIASSVTLRTIAIDLSYLGVAMGAYIISLGHQITSQGGGWQGRSTTDAGIMLTAASLAVAIDHGAGSYAERGVTLLLISAASAMSFILAG